MELTDQQVLQQLLDSASPLPGKSGPRPPIVITESPSRRVPLRRRCTCGTCHVCLDNARWDRIFNEKFVDPDYYQDRSPRHGSSLAWL